jgi:hypothetical protein
MLTRLFSDNAYIHYIRPRGPLEANLRVHLPRGAFPLIAIRMYALVFVNMNALSLRLVAVVTARAFSLHIRSLSLYAPLRHTIITEAGWETEQRSSHDMTHHLASRVHLVVLANPL